MTYPSTLQISQTTSCLLREGKAQAASLTTRRGFFLSLTHCVASGRVYSPKKRRMLPRRALNTSFFTWLAHSCVFWTSLHPLTNPFLCILCVSEFDEHCHPVKPTVQCFRCLHITGRWEVHLPPGEEESNRVQSFIPAEWSLLR